jgi:ribosomal protein S18 acetylase RimI-like enzyme
LIADVNIRRELRPGDLGVIIAHHGRLYAQEYGVDVRFEAHVANSVASAALHGFPREHEAIWIVEQASEHAGSVALTDEGGGEATLRWFLLEPQLRGRGLGRQLVGEVLSEARAAGYSLIALETFSELAAAARIYRAYGFEVVWEETSQRWGRPEITYQRYELALRREVGQSPSGREAQLRVR